MDYDKLLEQIGNINLDKGFKGHTYDVLAASYKAIEDLRAEVTRLIEVNSRLNSNTHLAYYEGHEYKSQDVDRAWDRSMAKMRMEALERMSALEGK